MEHSSALEIAPKLEKIRVYPRNLKLSIFFRTKGVEYLITGIHCRTTYRTYFKFIFIFSKAQLSATNSFTIKSYYSSCKKIFVNLSESTVHVGLRNIVPCCGTLPLVALHRNHSTRQNSISKTVSERLRLNNFTIDLWLVSDSQVWKVQFTTWTPRFSILFTNFRREMHWETAIPLHNCSINTTHSLLLRIKTRSPEILLISMGYLSRLQIRSISHV